MAKLFASGVGFISTQRNIHAASTEVRGRPSRRPNRFLRRFPASRSRQNQAGFTHSAPLGFLGGPPLFLPVIAWLGDIAAERYADAVMLAASMFKDGMLLILGFYVGRHQSGDQAA